MTNAGASSPAQEGGSTARACHGGRVPIIRVLRHERCYTVVDNDLVNNSRLSFRARGVLLWLLSKPDGWTVNQSAIARMGLETPNAIKRVFVELHAAGHLEQVPIPGKGGRGVHGSELVVHERPIEKPQVGVSGEVPDVSENRPVTNVTGQETSPLVSTDSLARTDLEAVKTERRSSPTKRPGSPGDGLTTGLCNRLADAIIANGCKPPVVSKEWLVDMDRLLRLDKRDPQEVADVIDWCQQSGFWRGNIHSPFKLRKQFDTLRLQRLEDLRPNRRTRSNGVHYERLQAEMIADGRLPTPPKELNRAAL